ncbi:hypothetical protein PHET_08265 [Paragonimus heterotremus]|uniref:RETREG1-3/ARL6IP-like N-terminal reticulon-homology domain-containing protein n=1 Tax=Paragonimus heterotremus TaxID=100268 RepID=A0A8J4T625_9TREM|nr:hypothetical protein PHET_08265 [Paragonimus heterotremus]
MPSKNIKFYEDVFALINRWDFLILRIEVLLLWERVFASFIFNTSVHLIFWLIAITNQSSLFVVCVLLSLYTLCDTFKDKIKQLVDDPAQTPGSFTHYVTVSVKQGHILSIEELSFRIARVLHCLVSVMNSLAPCRRSRPLLFFLITSGSSLACIWISAYLPGLAVSYCLLNVCLIAPVLVHHRITTRLWHTIKPVLVRIETEFDRHPLESPEERRAGEAAFYEPIIAAASSYHPELLSDGNGEGFLADSFLFSSKQRRSRSNSEEIDSSEAVFIKQFVPQLSSDEFDRLFTDVLEAQARNPTYRDGVPESPAFAELPTSNEAPGFSHVMVDEYATDEDELEEITGDDEISDS